MTLTWEGWDQGKVHRTGMAQGDDPVVVIQQFWPHGWRMLVVRDERGIPVGIIGQWKGRRSWMAYQTADPGASP